jgi:hypothetical protein
VIPAYIQYSQRVFVVVFKRTMVYAVLYLFEINRKLTREAEPQNSSLRQQQIPISIISHEVAVGLCSKWGTIRTV